MLRHVQSAPALVGRLRLALARQLDRIDSILLFAVSFLVAVAFHALSPDVLQSTVSGDYTPQLKALQEGRFFRDERGYVMDRYPPVYPLILLALTTISDISGIQLHVIQAFFAILCVFVSSLLVYRIARLQFGHRTSAIVALWFICYPHLLVGVLMPLSETPFVVVIYASLLAMLAALANQRISFARGMLTGSLLGLACLIRPIVLFLPLLYVAIPWAFPRITRPAARWRWASGVLVGFILLLVPWQAYVYSYRQSVMVSSGGLPSMRDGFSFNHKDRIPLTLPVAVAQFSDEVWEAYPSLTSMRALGTLIVNKGLHEPWSLLQVYLYKAGRSWYGLDTQNPVRERANRIVVLVYLAPSLVGLILGLRSRRRTNVLIVVLTGLTVYFWAMTTLVLSIVRYMVPVIAILPVLAGFLWERIIGDTSEVDVPLQPASRLQTLPSPLSLMTSRTQSVSSHPPSQRGVNDGH
jgi:hypothetical protein